jgi:hypothetical protein
MRLVAQSQAPAVLHLGKSRDIHFTAGWLPPRPVRKGVEKRKPLAATGARMFTVQLVESRYTDYSTPGPTMREWTDITQKSK